MMRSAPPVAAVVLLLFSLIAGGPAAAQTVPPPLTLPDQPLPGQSPNPSVIIIAPPILIPSPIDVGPGGFGARSPLSDTSPSARPAGIGGQALGDTSPSSRAVGQGGRAIGDTSPSSVGAPAFRPPAPAPGEPGYTGSAVGIR